MSAPDPVARYGEALRQLSRIENEVQRWQSRYRSQLDVVEREEHELRKVIASGPRTVPSKGDPLMPALRSAILAMAGKFSITDVRAAVDQAGIVDVGTKQIANMLNYLKGLGKIESVGKDKADKRRHVYRVVGTAPQPPTPKRGHDKETASPRRHGPAPRSTATAKRLTLPEAVQHCVTALPGPFTEHDIFDRLEGLGCADVSTRDVRLVIAAMVESGDLVVIGESDRNPGFLTYTTKEK